MGSLLQTDVHLQLDALKVLSSTDKTSLTLCPLLYFLSRDASVHSLTPSEFKEGLKSSRFIVERGPGCMMHFTCSFDDISSEYSCIDILQRELVKSIVQAPWWHQLPLTASQLKDLPPKFPDCSPLTFSLSLKNTLPGLPFNNDGNSLSSGFADVPIPTPIRPLKLKEIHIKLQFKGIPSKEVLRPDELLLDEQSDEDLLMGDDLQLDGALTGDMVSERPPHEDDLMSDEINLLGEADSQKVPSLVWTSSQEGSQGSSQSSSSMIYESHRPQKPTSSLLSTSTAIALTSLALRSLIGGSQARKTAGFTMCKPLPKYHLSNLMPLLFSPGFASNLSHQSANITAISQAMSSISLTVQSPALKEELAKLKTKNSNASLFDAVKAASFKTMHKSLYDPKACRKLVTSSQKTEKEDDLEDRDLMLDGETASRPDATKDARPILQIRLDRGNSFVLELEDMSEEELLSDNEIDMLLDLEIMKRQQGQTAKTSCSILLHGEEKADEHPSNEEDPDHDMIDMGYPEASDKGSMILECCNDERDTGEPSLLLDDSADRMQF